MLKLAVYMGTTRLEIVMKDGRFCKSTFVKFKRSLTLFPIAKIFLSNY